MSEIYHVPRFRPSIAPHGLMHHLKRHHPDLWRIATLCNEMDRHNKAVIQMRSDAQRQFAAERAQSVKPGSQVASATTGPNEHPAPQAGATESSDSAGVESEPRHRSVDAERTKRKRVKPFFYALADIEGRPILNDFCVAENPHELEELNQNDIDNLTAKIVPVYTGPQIEVMRGQLDDANRCAAFRLVPILESLAGTLGTGDDWSGLDAAAQKLKSQLAELVDHGRVLEQERDDWRSKHAHLREFGAIAAAELRNRAEAARDRAMVLEAKLAAEQAKGNWQGQHELEMTRVRERNLLADRDRLAGRVKELEAKLAEAERDRDEAQGLIHDAETTMGEAMAEREAARQDRATAEAARAGWSENGEWIRAEKHHEALAKARMEREKALQCHGDVPCGACITCLNGKLDAAQARVAELEKLRSADLERLGTKDDATLANRMLEAERARVAELEAKLAEEEAAHGEALQERDHLGDLLLLAVNAFDPDWEYSNINLPESAVDLISHMAADRDLIAAELAALKARKVKPTVKPTIEQAAWELYCKDAFATNACAGSKFGYDSWDALPQRYRDEYIGKVRAAGVEVEA